MFHLNQSQSLTEYLWEQPRMSEDWNSAQVTSPCQCLVWGWQQICPKVLKVVHMQHFFYSYLKPKWSVCLTRHLYPSIFPDLLAPHPLRASAALSVEYSLHTTANTLAWTDTIDASPVLMDFAMIAQRMAKDNCSPSLIQPKDDELYFGCPD